MAIPEVSIAGKSDFEKRLSSLTIVFAANPLMRWIYPDPENYLTAFPEMARCFAGQAFENNSAYDIEDFQAVEPWLPPFKNPGFVVRGKPPE